MANAATGLITGMDISSYLVDDPKKAIAFYRDVLGIEPTAVDEANGAEFTLADGSTFGVWHDEQSGFTKGGLMMFHVADVKDALTKFRSNGAELSEAMETTVCFMSHGVDPAGNPFVIHQRK